MDYNPLNKIGIHACIFIYMLNGRLREKKSFLTEYQLINMEEVMETETHHAATLIKVVDSVNGG